MEKVIVSAQALRHLLEAVTGGPHLIRELQVTRRLLGGDNPINTLVDEYNQAVAAHNAMTEEP